MPKPPVPPSIDAFLAKPNASVMATVRPDGQPVSVATWYLWDNGRILLNLDGARKRLEHLRKDPRVSLTIFPENWYAHVSLQGHVVEILEDTDLADVDRVSRLYTGNPYPTRDRERFSAWVDVDWYHVWGDLPAGG